MFSDKIAIEVACNRSKFVYRARGARIQDSHTIRRRGFSIKVMFWGAITSEGPGPLVPIEGTVNAERYITILNDNALPLLQNDNRIFQHDNARSHTASRTSDFLANNNVSVFPWPPYLPDMNLIENVWSLLKQKVNETTTRSRSDFISKAQTVWTTDNDVAQMCRNIYNSMPNRITALIIAKGGYTGY